MILLWVFSILLILIVGILLLYTCFSEYYKAEPKDKIEGNHNHTCTAILLFQIFIGFTIDYGHFTQGWPTRNVSCHDNNEYLNEYSFDSKDDGCGGLLRDAEANYNKHV